MAKEEDEILPAPEAATLHVCVCVCACVRVCVSACVSMLLTEHLELIVFLTEQLWSTHIMMSEPSRKRGQKGTRKERRKRRKKARPKRRKMTRRHLLKNSRKHSTRLTWILRAGALFLRWLCLMLLLLYMYTDIMSRYLYSWEHCGYCWHDICTYIIEGRRFVLITHNKRAKKWTWFFMHFLQTSTPWNVNLEAASIKAPINAHPINHSSATILATIVEQTSAVFECLGMAVGMIHIHIYACRYVYV